MIIECVAAIARIFTKAIKSQSQSQSQYQYQYQYQYQHQQVRKICQIVTWYCFYIALRYLEPLCPTIRVMNVDYYA